jgi:hypothetical protein
VRGGALGVVLTALLMNVAAAAAAKEKPAPPPEPTSKPEWSASRKTAEALLKSRLFDPASAQIEWTSGFEWGYFKPLIGKRSWGWVACVFMNAKNRLGGYVGAEGYYVLHTTDNMVTIGPITDGFSQCDTPRKVPLQAALIDPATTPGQVSVADEMLKLASLLDKGLITRAEFDEQKARLLTK